MGEGSRRGRPDPAPRDRRGEGERARPDPPALDVEAREGDAEGRRTGARAPSSPRRSGCSARSRTRAGTGTRRTSHKLVQVAKALPLDVGAALLASSEGYTPRANTRARPRPARSSADDGDRERPRRQPARAEGASRKSRRRKRKKKPRRGARQQQQQRQPARPGERARRANGARRRSRRRARGRRPQRRRRRRRADGRSRPAARAGSRNDPRNDLARLRVSSMLILIAIGFVAGIVTALSPCVLPVLPIVLAGGATGAGRSRSSPGSSPASPSSRSSPPGCSTRSGCPEDVLRNLAIALLFLVALSLLVPRVGELLARPLQALTRRRSGDLGGGFLLGASLGLVFVPCAGPVLAAVTVIAAKRDVGLDGARAHALLRARRGACRCSRSRFAGQRAAGARARTRSTSAGPRACSSALAALAIAFGVDRELQTRSPATPSRSRTGSSAPTPRSASSRELPARGAAEAGAATRRGELQDYGPAPEFPDSPAGSTPSRSPSRGLRGRVVLIDFWTYSCINCLRTLPYIREWDDALPRSRADDRRRPHARVRVRAGRVERARERQASWLRYPIALDNDYGTWQAWHNQYWPAKYLIDRERPRPLLPLRRRRVRQDGGGDPHAARRRRPAGRRRPRRTRARTASSHPRATSATSGSRVTAAARDPKDAEHAYTFPRGARGQRARLRRALEGRGRAGDRRPRRPAAPRLSRPQRLPRAHRTGSVQGARRRQAGAHGAGQRRPALHARRAERNGTTCSSCASPRASRATPSRSVNLARRVPSPRPISNT